MPTQTEIDFERIAKAISYLKQNFKQQPDLEALAESVHLSPFHFQKMFTAWAGVSPKKFLQVLSLDYAKKMLRENQVTIEATTFEIGLSSTSRLHSLFVKIVGMSPAEYKNAGEGLQINYQYISGIFGKMLIASTTKGICFLSFVDDENTAFQTLIAQFPKAAYVNQADHFQKDAIELLSGNAHQPKEILLHLKGTEFQLKVWQALLQIPSGSLSTYGNIAQKIIHPKAARAVGTAIGSNPIAYIIPCHRVIQSTGFFGGYMWGSERKTAIISWEAAQKLDEQHNIIQQKEKKPV